MRKHFKSSRRAAAVLIATALLIPSLVSAQSTMETHFDQTWARADGPVAAGLESRTWIWGPTKYGPAIMEEYAESPGGERLVQYFDKARMEITHPAGDPTSEWYVTNGLLVMELITGQLQVGDAEFEQRIPAEVNIAGDSDDLNGPTYATFSNLLDEPATPAGWFVTSRIGRDASVTDDPSLASYNVIIAATDDVTGHGIAQPFWDFMHTTGTIWGGAAYTTGSLFMSPLVALGRPIAEPYWADVVVAGTDREVLLQCFERRCLTYTPGNPEGWVVEAGNVGRHYHDWRYDGIPPIVPEPIEPQPTDPDPEPIVPPGEPLPAAPPTTDMDCSDFPSQEVAQAYFDSRGGSPTNNVDGLDEDGDGIVCESPAPSTPSNPGGGSGADGGFNCEDFPTQAAAQAHFDSQGGSPTNNVDGLDADGDGIACENNPSGGGGGAVDPPPPARPK